MTGRTTPRIEPTTYGEGTSPFRPRGKPSLLHLVSPLTAVLAGYDGRTFGRDAFAGLTVAALAIPSGIAYAELAGVPAVAGLYALLLPTVGYALLGSSRQLVIGPEGSVAALVATAVVPLAAGDSERYVSLAALLALLVATIFVVARIVHLGWIADYFSRAVLTGYIHGVAIVLLIGQLGKVFGLDLKAREPLGQLAEFARDVGQPHGATLLVGVASLTPLLLVPRFASRIPVSLLVVVGATIASSLLALEDRGVAVVGKVASGLPAIALPSWQSRDALDLLPAAIGIFLVSYADGILTARSFAGRHDQHVRSDQELLALGVANAAAGLSQAFPVAASGSRTAVNDQSGSRTQIAGLIGAGAVAVVLLLFTDAIHDLPKAALGAVIIAAALGLLDVGAWRILARTSRAELLIAAATTAGVVLVGVLEALVIAVAMSIFDAIRRSASPHDAVVGWVNRLGRYADVRLHPSATVPPGVLVYRLDDRLFFANASYVRGRIREAIHGAPQPVRAFVFDAEALNHIDTTGAHMLAHVITSLQDEGVSFSVARLKEPMRRAFADEGLLSIIGDDHVFPTNRAAVDAVSRPVARA
jgi:SulP family sulfate permease